MIAVRLWKDNCKYKKKKLIDKKSQNKPRLEYEI